MNYKKSKVSASQIGIRLALVTICLALSAVAHASTVLTLDGNYAPPDYAFYSYTDIYGVTHDSIPVGPYITTLNGDGYDNVTVLTFCYDFDSPTNVGTPYSGSILPVSAFSDPTLTALMESTYLIDVLAGDGMLSAPLATRGAISMAIWEFMNPSSPTGSSPFPSDPAALPYEAQAAAAVSGGAWTTADADLYPTWMPDNPSIQRFGFLLPDPPPVPEPATLAFVGFGLVGIGVFLRKRRV